jgi:hypothetical protein
MAEAQVLEAKQASNVVTSENLTEWTMNRLGLATDESPTEAEAVEETPELEPVAEEGESEQDSETEGKAFGIEVQVFHRLFRTTLSIIHIMLFYWNQILESNQLMEILTTRFRIING